MNGYSATMVFKTNEIKIWKDATEAVQAIPENTHLRCHELVRAIGIYLFEAKPAPLVCDGHFGMVEHSWLLIPPPSGYPGHRHIILDVYAVGSMPMVQLIDAGSLGIREARQYKEGPARRDIDEKMIETLLVTISRHHQRK